jgi:hypothetical protein
LAAVAVGVRRGDRRSRLVRHNKRTELVLEVVFADEEALRRHFEERLNADVSDLAVLELDYVRDITRVAVRYISRPPV